MLLLQALFPAEKLNKISDRRIEFLNDSILNSLAKTLHGDKKLQESIRAEIEPLIKESEGRK